MFLFACSDLCRYIIYQLEAGANGTKHYQGYVELHSKVRLNGMKTMPGFARAHFEIAKGDQEANIRYCSKEPRLEPTVQWGEKVVPGKNKTSAGIKRCLDLIKDGKTIKEISDAVGAYTDAAIVPSAIGAGYGQIVGSKYLIKKIRIKGELLPVVSSDAADVPVPASVRIVVVLDTQPNGAQAQGEDIFTDLGNAQQCNYSFLALAAGAGGRFKILKDQMFLSQPAVAGTDGTNTNSTSRSGCLFNFEWQPSKPLTCRVKASSATPTVATLSDNNIFILAHSGTGTTLIVGAARCYYVD